MNRPAQSRSKIRCLLALTLPLGLLACGAQDSDDAFSEIALPTFSNDRMALEAPVEIRRMLSGGRLAFGAPVPSPDGRWVTAIEGRDLAVRDLVTGETRRVTVTPEGVDGSAEVPVFSPDGSRIAYIWRIRGERWELRSIGMDGTGISKYKNVLSISLRKFPHPPRQENNGIVTKTHGNKIEKSSL